ncbi:hypothetical protein [Sphingomonas sp.]|jgi:hypothetical protein|uniref:hypothetical protein n=1 Tax=Sphingomonas sp. TaxID=28214 RepID=UPI002ED78CB0
MSRGPDAATLIERGLIASAEAAGCAVTIPACDCTRWASATFVGAQHRLTLKARASVELDAWLVVLPEAEFAFRGHLVADLAVTRVSREGDTVTIQIEALTVEDR